MLLLFIIIIIIVCYFIVVNNLLLVQKVFLYLIFRTLLQIIAINISHNAKKKWL